MSESGQKPEVQRGPRNVWCWGRSGSRFRAPGGLLVANIGSDPNHGSPICAPAVLILTFYFELFLSQFQVSSVKAGS